VFCAGPPSFFTTPAKREFPPNGDGGQRRRRGRKRMSRASERAVGWSCRRRPTGGASWRWSARRRRWRGSCGGGIPEWRVRSTARPGVSLWRWGSIRGRSRCMRSTWRYLMQRGTARGWQRHATTSGTATRARGGAGQSVQQPRAHARKDGRPPRRRAHPRVGPRRAAARGARRGRARDRRVSLFEVQQTTYMRACCLGSRGLPCK